MEITSAVTLAAAAAIGHGASEVAQEVLVCTMQWPPPLRRVIGRQNHKPTEDPQRITDLVREPNRLGDSSAPLCDKFEGVSMNDAKAFPKPRLYTSTKIKCI